MKRQCSLCLRHTDYRFVKKYSHGLKMCAKCQHVMMDLAEEAITLQRYRC